MNCKRKLRKQKKTQKKLSRNFKDQITNLNTYTQLIKGFYQEFFSSKFLKDYQDKLAKLSVSFKILQGVKFKIFNKWSIFWLTRKFCILLRPDHWATLPTKGSLSCQLENQNIRGFRAHPTLRSNRPGELVVTREARIDDRKLVFRFWKIYALKNTADWPSHSKTLSI